MFELLSNDNYDIFNDNSTTHVENAKTAQKRFDTLCYNFIINNKEKYALSNNDLTNINYSMAKIQYSMLKQFCMIYWSQIIEQLINNSGLDSAIDYLTNKINKNEY